LEDRAGSNGFKIDIDKVKKCFDSKIGIYYDIDLENDFTDVKIFINLNVENIAYVIW